MGTKTLSVNELWKSVSLTHRIFHPANVAALPGAAQSYLTHAIAPGTPLAAAVRLRMHGEIKLKRWLPFQAEQVIAWQYGMIWSATVFMNGFPIYGTDRLIDGQGAMQWKLLGLFPIMSASGADVTRSSIGRVQAESVWLPSVFCKNDLSWTTTDATEPSELQAHLTAYGNPTDLTLTVEPTGQLKAVRLSRWGNPEGAEFHAVDFGGLVEAEGTFYGYTIPTNLRVGWYLGSDRFESEGEFFRVTVDDAVYQ